MPIPDPFYFPWTEKSPLHPDVSEQFDVAFGQAQAHALGRELPSAVLNAAQIVLADEPAVLLAGAAKRRLWTALRQLRRVPAGH